MTVVVTLAVTATGCSASQTVGTGSSTIDGVTVVAATPVDEAALVKAFDTYENFAPTCTAETVPDTVRVAAVSATATSWALAAFQPSSTCVFYEANPVRGQPDVTIAGRRSGPFAELGGPPMGTFERSASGRWSMNSETGVPFPCPAPGGIAPGPGGPSIPSEVLKAWGLAYAQGCANQVVPPAPR